MSKVSQILERKGNRVLAIDKDAPVLDAIRLMAEHHIGAVLVMHGEELVGIASERDYARKIVLQGRSSSDTPVGLIMTSPVICVAPSDSITDCMSIMTERHVRHLPVLEDGRLVGVVSIGDLVKELIEEQKQEITYLQRYIAS